jgi:hypothetical protein
MSKSRLISGRAKKKLGTELSLDRYEYLDVGSAEPDLGLPPVDDSILIGDLDGSRTWTDITTYAEQFKGYTGSKGQGFIIAKTYSSVAALVADTEPSGIVAGEFAIVDTNDVEDPENSKLYLWTGSSYNFVTDLSGEQGIKGETGFTGSQGNIGFTGSAGLNGTDGISSDGDPGFTGSQGETGFTGSLGYTGSQGDIGFTGSAGAAGGDGLVGFTGSQGDIGFTGSAGTGFTGSAGAGFTGSRGDIGYSGSGSSDIISITYTPAFKGALRSSSGSQTIGSNTWTTLTGYDTIQYDTNNFCSVADRFTIPAGVTKVKLSASVIRNSATEQLLCRIIKNGSLDTFTTQVDIDSTGADNTLAITPVLSVTENDYFTLEAFADNGATIPLNATNNWFSIEVLEGSILNTTEIIKSTGFTGSQGNLGFTGSIGFTGSAGAGFTGSQGLVGFTGSAGSGSGGGVGIANLYQLGTLIVFEGTARWYAPFDLEFQTITARVIENANDDIEIEIKKNGILLTELTVPVGEYSAVLSSTNPVLTMDEGDYLTVDILQVGTVVQPGSDLYIQFKYVNI